MKVRIEKEWDFREGTDEKGGRRCYIINERQSKTSSVTSVHQQHCKTRIRLTSEKILTWFKKTRKSNINKEEKGINCKLSGKKGIIQVI